MTRSRRRALKLSPFNWDLSAAFLEPAPDDVHVFAVLLGCLYHALRWYPPATAVVRPSRLNGIGQVCFYGSNMPNAALLELRPQPGHVFTVVITLSSIHVTVALIVLIEKIVATMALIAAQEVEISLVEYDPEQIVVYARRHPERTFHHVDLCASPLDHEHK